MGGSKQIKKRTVLKIVLIVLALFALLAVIITGPVLYATISYYQGNKLAKEGNKQAAIANYNAVATTMFWWFSIVGPIGLRINPNPATRVTYYFLQSAQDVEEINPQAATLLFQKAIDIANKHSDVNDSIRHKILVDYAKFEEKRNNNEGFEQAANEMLASAKKTYGPTSNQAYNIANVLFWHYCIAKKYELAMPLGKQCIEVNMKVGRPQNVWSCGLVEKENNAYVVKNVLSAELVRLLLKQIPEQLALDAFPWSKSFLKIDKTQRKDYIALDLRRFCFDTASNTLIPSEAISLYPKIHNDNHTVITSDTARVCLAKLGKAAAAKEFPSLSKYMHKHRYTHQMFPATLVPDTSWSVSRLMPNRYLIMENKEWSRLKNKSGITKSELDQLMKTFYE